MNETSKLETENISKLLISLALPSIIAQLVNLLYNIVDRIYIGHLPDSSNALGGLAVALPVITIITAVTQLFGTGGAPLAAIKLGEKDQEGAEKIMMNSFVGLITSGVVLTILILIFAKPLLYLFGADSSTIQYGLDYIRIYALGTIFVQISIGMNAYINTQGYAKMGMATVIIGAILNIILDPILIFIFDMGVKGAAIATIFSQFVSAVWVLYFLNGNHITLRMRRNFMKPDFKILLSIMALGVSPFIMVMTESFLQISFNQSMSKYGGTLAVSTMAILFSLSQFITLPLQGLAQGAQPITSYNFGAKRLDRVRDCFKLLFKICLSASLIIGITVMVFSKNFAALFSSDPDVQHFGEWAIRIYLFGLSIFGAQIACQQSFMALGQAKKSILMALFRKIILLIPLIFIFPMILGNTNFAANMAQPIAHYCKDSARVFAVLFAEPVSDIFACVTTTVLFLNFYKNSLKEE